MLAVFTYSPNQHTRYKMTYSLDFKTRFSFFRKVWLIAIMYCHYATKGGSNSSLYLRLKLLIMKYVTKECPDDDLQRVRPSAGREGD